MMTLVRITGGSFEGYEAIYQAKHVDKDIIILLNICEQHTH